MRATEMHALYLDVFEQPAPILFSSTVLDTWKRVAIIQS
jgi:hypothetical protein